MGLKRHRGMKELFHGVRISFGQTEIPKWRTWQARIPKVSAIADQSLWKG